MPSINEVINKLIPYGKLTNIFAAETALASLVSVANPADKLIEDARKELQALLVKVNIKQDDISLAEVAHAGLLVLAELKPSNEKDPITLDTIEADDRVVVSTGHQFSLTSLIGYHNGRRYKSADEYNEFADSKWLLNPLTRSSFNAMDIKHIQQMALKREEKLIDNVVFDLFNDLSFNESVALIRKQLRIENLRLNNEAPAPAPAPVRDNNPPNQNRSALSPALDDRGYTLNIPDYSGEDLARIFASIPSTVTTLNLSTGEALNRYGIFASNHNSALIEEARPAPNNR